MNRLCQGFGADTLIFNANPNNATPREFVEFLNRSGLRPQKTEMDFGGFKGIMDLLHKDQPVNGYVINPKMFKEMNKLKR